VNPGDRIRETPLDDGAVPVDAAVPADEVVERLAVGDVQAAASGEQELATHRRHVLDQRDLPATARHDLGSDQPGRSPAHDDDGSPRLHRFNLRNKHVAISPEHRTVME
jgi:hypothetical protein